MKRNKIQFLLAAIVGLVVLVIGIWRFIVCKQPSPIKIGVIHSLTGDMAHLEKGLLESILLAVEEINKKGGILGKKIEPIIADTESNEALFAQKAQKLIEEDHVEALFGAWESGPRKRIVPVAEKYNILFFHGVITEGLEVSKNLIITGPTANQSILPAATWCFYNLGKRFFILGGNRIFSEATYELTKLQLEMLGATIVGSMLLPDDFTDITSIISSIYETKPDVIFNFLDSYTINKELFKQLRLEEITPEKVPIISFSFDEAGILDYGAEILDGTYATLTYLQDMDTLENHQFVDHFKKKYGKDRDINDSMIASYANIYVWAQAVENAQTTATDVVREHIKNHLFNGPRGPLFVDHNLYTWLTTYIGKVRYDGSVEILWTSKKAMCPEPYPPYKDKNSWNNFLMDFYRKWHNTWEPS